jgi:hypothetical protein
MAIHHSYMTRLSTILWGGLLLSWGGLALAKPPTLTYLDPAGGERGSVVKVTASGTFGRWPVQCWVDGRGVTASALPDKGKLSLTIASDAPPGVRWLRVFDEEGASELRPFVVGMLPEVAETEPNEAPEKAQAVDLPATINARLGGRSDLDSYSVALREGETLVASMEANSKLGSPMDGLLQVVSSGGFVLASSDDDRGLDPQIVFHVPADDRYIVRAFGYSSTPDSRIGFGGGDSWIYRLTLTTGGFLDHVFPLAVSRAEPGEVEATGWNIPDAARKIPVVADEASAEAVVSHPLLGNGHRVRLEPHAALVEAESAGPKDPQQIPIPSTISGRIDPASDVDAFRFSARKGQKLTIKVESRSLGHPLDPVLRLTDSARKVIAEVDDPGSSGGRRGGGRRRGADLGRDAELAFTAPVDGDYRVEVRDLYGHGGMRYAYRLSVTVTEPDYALTLAADRYTATPGKPLAIPVTVERRDGFDGPIEIQATDLPEGVTSSPVTSLPTGGSAKSVTLQVTSASGPTAGPFRVVGVSPKQGDGQRPPRTATIPSPGGGASLEQAWITILKP